MVHAPPKEEVLILLKRSGYHFGGIGGISHVLDIDQVCEITPASPLPLLSWSLSPKTSAQSARLCNRLVTRMSLAVHSSAEHLATLVCQPVLMPRFPHPAFFRQSILYGLAAAMFVMTAIGIVGMSISVLVAESVQGSGSAINVAGSLRKQSHLMGSIVLSNAENQVANPARLNVAISQFESSLTHEALLMALSRTPNGPAEQTYQSVRDMWQSQLKPWLEAESTRGALPSTPRQHNALLALIDNFVEQINTMVTQLEEETEARIRNLRSVLAIALVMTILVAFAAIYFVRRDVLLPIAALHESAARTAKGDFSARVSHTGPNELGQVGQTFNFMATELSKLYQDLEQRVDEKTHALTRSNRSLELLYHSIARLHDAPVAPDTYQAMLEEMDQALGLVGSMACVFSPHGGPPSVLASTLPLKDDESSHCTCETCPTPHLAQPDSERYLRVPLRDTERQYGMLTLLLPEGHALEAWQTQLLQALVGHIGIAMGISHKTERERLISLQEERSIIARELHDSLAQSLSYMKIQASLLQPMLSDPKRRDAAETTLGDLRNGITSAYRQLRELLATFRLRMEGDFLALISETVQEYAGRSGIDIQLEITLGDAHLNPNQEIHTLQIVREALSNIARHAHAHKAWVRIRQDAGEIVVRIEDDGVGLTPPASDDVHHYGLSIMRERANGLHGTIHIENRPQGGSVVELRFKPRP